MKILKEQIRTLETALEKDAILHEIAARNYNREMVDSELRYKRVNQLLQDEKFRRTAERDGLTDQISKLREENKKLQKELLSLTDSHNALKQHTGIN